MAEGQYVVWFDDPRVNASVAAYTEHWESHGAGVETVLGALREYEVAAHALIDRRAQHAPGSASARAERNSVRYQ